MIKECRWNCKKFIAESSNYDMDISIT